MGVLDSLSTSAVRDVIGKRSILKLRDGKHVLIDAAIANVVYDGYMDANEGFFFQRELEFIKTRSYDVQYADLQARDLFPVSNEGGMGIVAITYRTYDQVGAAKIINSYADDLPRADVSAKETTIPVRSVGISFGYNLDEIQSSSITGQSLDQRRANAGVRAVEQTVNNIAWFGDASSGLPGFLTNPNIPVGPVVDPGAGTEWVNKNPDEILFDVNDLFADIIEVTHMVERPNTLLVPPRQRSYIASTPRSANSDTTILQFIVQNSPYIAAESDIIGVNELQAANNPTQATDMMVAYDRNPDKLQLEIPVELEWMPVQQKNLEFIVPGRNRQAGLNIYYPLSVAFATGI